MKYTPILAITLLTLVEPIICAPIQQTSPAYLARSELPFPPTAPHAVGLESRQLSSEKRDKAYGFGEPTHFAVLPAPLSRPNPCANVAGCTTSNKLKPRELSVEERRVQRAVRKRSIEDGEFITNVEFKPE